MYLGKSFPHPNKEGGTEGCACVRLTFYPLMETHTLNKTKRHSILVILLTLSAESSRISELLGQHSFRAVAKI